RADDLDVVFVDQGPVFQQPDRHRVWFLAGGTGRTPDADARVLAKAAQPLREQIRGEALQLVVFAIKVRLVDRERIDELLDLLVQVRTQVGGVRRKGACAGRRDAVGNPALDVVAPGLGEHHAGAPIKNLA